MQSLLPSRTQTQTDVFFFFFSDGKNFTVTKTSKISCPQGARNQSGVGETVNKHIFKKKILCQEVEVLCMNEPAEKINERNRSEVKIRPEKQSSLNPSIYK